MSTTQVIVKDIALKFLEMMNGKEGFDVACYYINEVEKINQDEGHLEPIDIERLKKFAGSFHDSKNDLDTVRKRFQDYLGIPYEISPISNN
jgi:hypothetical protein